MKGWSSDWWAVWWQVMCYAALFWLPAAAAVFLLSRRRHRPRADRRRGFDVTCTDGGPGDDPAARR